MNHLFPYLLLLLTACGSGDDKAAGADSGQGGDADSDMDTDGDADTDSDSGSDSDSDVDTDTATDSDTGTIPMPDIEFLCTWKRMDVGDVPPLRGVWGSSPTDVYAVGDAGTILHFDGAGWSEIDVAIDFDLRGVHGLSSTEIYIATSSSLLYFDGNTWSEVCEDIDGFPFPLFARYSDTELLCPGVFSFVAIRTGECTETDIPAHQRQIELMSLWVDEQSEAYISGDYNLLSRIEDGAWNDMTFSSSVGRGKLLDLWGTSPEHLVVFHDGGQEYTDEDPGAIAVFRFDGFEWKNMGLGATPLPDLTYSGSAHFWGVSPTNIYLSVGQTVVFYDGEHWGCMEFEGDGPPTFSGQLWGFAEDSVFMVGGQDRGEVWHCSPD